jgi:hypothetical protein
MARIRRIERVLEFGCGNYSTKTFVNNSAFPHLKELHSVENDVAWGETIRTAVKHDNRCTVHLTPGAMHAAVSTFDLESFDLILIDDSTNAEQRAATIQTLFRVNPKNPWLTIHDYEVEDYQRAAAGFKHRFAFKAYNPHTGLVFNSASPPRRELKQLDQRLKANSSLLEPDDVDGWIRALHK